MATTDNAVRSDRATPALRARGQGAVVAWLYALAALVFAMVVVGGATRLTESGLSITEWQLVTGAVPPLGQEAWQAEFEKYRQIPQYRELNAGMSLAEFKTIYWWEWGHRFLGRLVGIAFLVPFLVFAFTGRIARGDYSRLVGLFALGGLQGAVGWFMVASGLSERVSVSHYRLGLHLTLACVIFAAIVWVARDIQARAAPAGPPAAPPAAAVHLSRWSLGLLALVVFQIFVGALVAGLDAGFAFNTWPLMDGRIVPPLASLSAMEPGWRNLFDNVMTVQFEHRMVAYALLAAVLWHAVDAHRRAPGSAAARGAAALAGLTLAQAAIGIATLVHVVPLGLALVHQAGAVLVLGAASVHAQRLRGAGG